MEMRVHFVLEACNSWASVDFRPPACDTHVGRQLLTPELSCRVFETLSLG